jgi:hypothetical protein
MRDALRRRIAKLEAAFAARRPLEPALIWRCGPEVTPADRRAAAKAAGERGAERIIYTVTRDASCPDRHAPAPEEIEAPNRLDTLRNRIKNLSADRARNAITEMHTLGRVDADEARTLRAELSARKSAA